MFRRPDNQRPSCTRGSVKRHLLSAGLALPLAQLGHILVYWVRYGSDALGLQSNGTHAYFPAMAQTSLVLLGTLLLAVLGLIGLSRILAGLRHDQEIDPGWPLASSAITLFAVQLAVFIGQEYAEALLQHGQVPALVLLATYGAVGQLPVALAAAVALSWATRRTRRAVQRLRAAATMAATIVIQPSPAAVLPSPRAQLPASPASIHLASLPLGKRAPPPSSRSTT